MYCRTFNVPRSLYYASLDTSAKIFGIAILNAGFIFIL